MQLPPLCVDLDGSLILTDLLHESILLLLKKNPLYLLVLPFWLLKGKAGFKREIARRVDIMVDCLPYHHELLQFLTAEARQGRAIYLVSASDESLVRKVAEYLGLFDDSFGSDGHLNLGGRGKARLLVDRFGERGFDYVGNAPVDFQVWEKARKAHPVGQGQGFIACVQEHFECGEIFQLPAFSLKTWSKALRLHQWVKNILIFLPLFAAHVITRIDLLFLASLAFVAFGMVASSVYIWNDLLDLEADRHHHRKRERPFASGVLPIKQGIIVSAIFLLAGAALAWSVNVEFFLVLAGYFSLTLLYSFYLKKKVLLDVLALAMLYTLRIIAGVAAIGIEISEWLLAFSVFFFFCLAFIKRHSELYAARSRQLTGAMGRGYVTEDLELLSMLGSCSGYMAVLVMALYINSPEIKALYRYPDLLWCLCLALLYWISRMWLFAHRGQMHDDPVIFALKDRVSYLIGILVVFVVSVASW